MTVMNREMILKHLGLARKHVALGEKHLLNQKLLIQRLEAGGRDASAVQSMLTQFEELQGMHIAGVVRLEKELAKSRNEPF